MTLQKILITMFLAGAAFTRLSAAENPAPDSDSVTWKSKFTFYADNTEFFEPYRLRETILGQQVTTFLEARAGSHSWLRAGLFADHRSAMTTGVEVHPVFSFIYSKNGLESATGSIFPVQRHGFLEPMEVTTMELTRPMEYGTQLTFLKPEIQTDFFLNWQNLLAASSREIFDYGVSAKVLLLEGVSVGFQAHGFHVGGVSFPGLVRNNLAGGGGLELESKLPLLGSSVLKAYGLASHDFNRPGYPGPSQGSGLYFKGAFTPLEAWTFFGIVWWGRDFMSEEGDSNYNSFGYDGAYYKSDRTYEEVGIAYTKALDPGVLFNLEARSHWVENDWSHSFRISVTAPFDLEIDLKKKQIHHGDTENTEKHND